MKILCKSAARNLKLINHSFVPSDSFKFYCLKKTKPIMAASRDHDNNNMNGYSSSSSEEDENIGFPFEFLETADFQCIICTHVIRGFTELPCGHAGCKFCIEEWEKRKV